MRREFIFSCAAALGVGFGLGVLGDVFGWGYDTTMALVAVALVIAALVLARIDPSLGRRTRP